MRLLLNVYFSAGSESPLCCGRMTSIEAASIAHQIAFVLNGRRRAVWPAEGLLSRRRKQIAAAAGFFRLAVTFQSEGLSGRSRRKIRKGMATDIVLNRDECGSWSSGFATTHTGLASGEESVDVETPARRHFQAGDCVTVWKVPPSAITRHQGVNFWKSDLLRHELASATGTCEHCYEDRFHPYHGDDLKACGGEESKGECGRAYYRQTCRTAYDLPGYQTIRIVKTGKFRNQTGPA